MENHIQVREYGWTDNSDSDFSADLFVEEQESNLLSSEDSETPFARHGPIVDPDPKEIVIQHNFWNLCAIGFILGYRNSRFVTYNSSLIMHGGLEGQFQ
nr:hypothetical protein CFP56_31169 [Quercus suber]